MEKIARAQTLGDAERAKWMRGQRSLEINPRHPLIVELKKQVGRWVGGSVGRCMTAALSAPRCAARPPCGAHPLSLCCPTQHEASPDSEAVKDTAHLLYQTCLLESGGWPAAADVASNPLAAAWAVFQCPDSPHTQTHRRRSPCKRNHRIVASHALWRTAREMRRPLRAAAIVSQASCWRTARTSTPASSACWPSRWGWATCRCRQRTPQTKVRAPWLCNGHPCVCVHWVGWGGRASMAPLGTAFGEQVSHWQQLLRSKPSAPHPPHRPMRAAADEAEEEAEPAADVEAAEDEPAVIRVPAEEAAADGEEVHLEL